MGKIGKLPDGAQQLAIDIINLKARAGEIGLYKTMHALEPATQAIGWEMAEILEGKRGDHLIDHPDLPLYQNHIAEEIQDD